MFYGPSSQNTRMSCEFFQDFESGLDSWAFVRFRVSTSNGCAQAEHLAINGRLFIDVGENKRGLAEELPAHLMKLYEKR